MIERPTAMVNGRIIGIESIYTVIDGKQINKPEKLKEVREWSQRNLLFCPCGCGSNLILVAGDKNLREQHFRIKSSENNNKCTYVSEGQVSIDSKVVLKCWLEEKLCVDDVESRVPICEIDDTKRKYEFTFLSRKRGLAIDYSRMRENLSEEKLDLLDLHGMGIHIIHIVDISNEGTDGQYQEHLMKIQNRQGCCLLLNQSDGDYTSAKLCAVIFEKDMKGIWEQVHVARGKLREFSIEADGDLRIYGRLLSEKIKSVRTEYQKRIEEERWKAEEAKKRVALLERQRKEEVAKRIEEENQRMEAERHFRERIRAEAERQRKRQELLQQTEEQRRKERFLSEIRQKLNQQDEKVVDDEGVRWVRCEICGKIAPEREFWKYGGRGRINIGCCHECKKRRDS